MSNFFNVNITDVVCLIKSDKKMMGIYLGVAAILGLIIAFTTPKTYKSSVMLAPEESGAGFSGSISSLASMIGMNMKLGQSGDAIYPELYPDLMSSTDFVVNMFRVKVQTQKGDVKCDYYTYLTKHQPIALVDYPKIALAKIIKGLKPAEQKSKRQDGARTPLWLSKDEDEVAQVISHKIECQVDKKTNVITITAEDNDPLVAALIADSAKAHLQEAITVYRTQKSRIDLDYMQKLFNEAKAQYDKARQTYASYADANQDVMLQSYKMKEEDLENEMQLKYNIYQQVVEQLQLAKAKVQERTPAFTTIQSASVPVKHSGRGKLSTLVVWLFFGFCLRSAILFWKNRKMFIIQ